MAKSLSSGAMLSRYRISSHVGSGGMGEVYKATDVSLDRSVALKILRADLVRNEDRLRRFVQEAKAASSLNHPHIVHIYEIGEAKTDAVGPINFIAMEYIEGVTLGEKIYRERAELKKLLALLEQVAEGLAKAHAAGLVHRDLKPDNIMVSVDGYAKIVDFGLAKLIDRVPISAVDDERTTQLREATQEGTILGTIGYMSPEQVVGRTIDHRSDIFSFGCILYEAVTRRRAFEASSSVDTLHKIMHEDPAPLSGDAPADLQRIVRRCLAKDPDDRYQSMKEVAIELRGLRNESVSGPRTGLSGGMITETAWRRIGVVAGVATSALVVIIVAFLLANARRHQSVTTTTSAAPRNAKIFTGEAIDLDLENADIRDVLRKFAQITGLNITADADVRGTVTVQFKHVPWDQALDIFVRQNGLTYVLEGNVLRVARVETMIREEEQNRRLRELEKATQTSR